MELLIVVAIIAVLIAIAIPVFGGQLEKAREATDAANIRTAYAEVSVAFLTGDTDNLSKSVTLKQKTAGWQNKDIGGANDDGVGVFPVAPANTPFAGGTCTVAADGSTGAVTITFVEP